MAKQTFYFVSCRKCSWSLEVQWFLKPNEIIHCPNGHRASKKFVEGRVSTRVSCEEKCQTAEGSKCTCACGGKAHGRLVAA